MRTFLQVKNLPPNLRPQYLGSLPEPQEWFLEERVRSGEFWECPGAGYAVLYDNVLVEFHAANSEDAPCLLSDLVHLRPFRKALCKSFDCVLMETAKTLGWSSIETGFLFRKRTPVLLERIDGFHLFRARSSDLSEAWSIGQDFYASRDEVEQLFQSSCLWVALKNGHMIGNATVIPIDGSGRVFDVGMVTKQDHRNKGFASLMIAEIANMLESDGKRPICGCAEGNIASKAALENAGFVSEHRLVHMDIPE